MWTKEKIDKFIDNYGFKLTKTKREIKELPNILHADEKLCGLLEGYTSHGLEGGISASSEGLVIATNKRIIFFHKSKFFGVISQQEMQLRSIVSCSYSKGVAFSKISFSTANNHITADWCDKLCAERFNKIVNELLSEQNAVNTNNKQNQQAQTNCNFEQLEKLFDLKQKGIITEKEFNQQKDKLFSI